MAYDLVKLKFAGRVYEIAEKDFGGSFSEDQDRFLIEAICQDYAADGSPKDATKWIKSRLASVFLSVSQRPQWVESHSMWPFWEGKPMVFIAQFEVENNAVADKHLSPGAVLYVFGIRTQTARGSELRYRVVSQYRELRGLKAVVTEQGIHLPKDD